MYFGECNTGKKGLSVRRESGELNKMMRELIFIKSVSRRLFETGLLPEVNSNAMDRIPVNGELPLFSTVDHLLHRNKYLRGGNAVSEIHRISKCCLIVGGSRFTSHSTIENIV